MWVDSHCHLHHDKISSGDVPTMIARAHEADVATMLTVSTSVDDGTKILPLLKAYEGVYGSVGVHPHETDPTLSRFTQSQLEEILRRDLSAHPKMIALGETGLDFYYGHSTIDNQKICFDLHLRLASELDLPVIIHTRDAEEETIAMLRLYKGRVRGVIHCFSGSLALARAALDMGFYISCSGLVTFPKADDLRAIIAQIPLDRILIETDSPYLAPVPYRGRPNEPAYMIATGEKIACIYQISLEEAMKKTTQNFWDLFRRKTKS